MLFFSQLSAITGGDILQKTIETPIRHLLLDSRKLMGGGAGLFFSMRGRHHDGHDFIAAAYEQGTRQFVVERRDPTLYQDLKSANVIQVPSSLHALQQVAAHHRNQYQLPLIAVTGSNGKTIVKEWLSQILSLRYAVVQSPQSYNSQVGVPLSAWLIDAVHEYGVFEAGISLPGEMSRIAAILKPTIGLFTNIGPAHDEGFMSQQQKLEEKALLFAHCEKIYYCVDHKPIHRLLIQLYGRQVQLVTWSLMGGSMANYQVQKHLLTSGKQTALTIITQGRRYSFVLPFQDRFSVENAIHCIILLLHEGFDADVLRMALTRLRTISMRMTLKQGLNHCQLIDDTYNNDLVGLQGALDFMVQQKETYRRTVILSDLLQTGIVPETLYRQTAQLLRARQVDRLIGIGEAMNAHAHAFAWFDAQFYRCTEELLKEDLQHKFSHELILLKGARPFGLERVVERLEQRIHDTVLEVNLDAITHNLNFFRSRLTSQTRLMAVVKALSYGSSSFEVAQLLQYHRVDYLAVAYADEGVLLREHGINLPIMVMNPTLESFDKLLRYNLEPEVYSFRLLYALRDFLNVHRKQIKLHVKLETGMRRLGFEACDLDELSQVLRATPGLHVTGIMSHLTTSSDPRYDAYTRHQYALFIKQATYLEEALGIQTTKHLLNSSGILRFPRYQLDMVRLGIGLYGVGVGTSAQNQLRIASTLKTIISQIKRVPRGAAVGYGRRGLVRRESRIATIAIGYADGFSRALGHGKGQVWLNGHMVPVIGEICMDMSMIDITHIPANEGDEVIIFGQQLPIARVADAMGTIPYEVLTGVSERVKRVYHTG